MVNEQNLDWDGGYAGVHICQNSWNYAPEICTLFCVNHISVKNELLSFVLDHKATTGDLNPRLPGSNGQFPLACHSGVGDPRKCPEPGTVPCQSQNEGTSQIPKKECHILSLVLKP